MMQPIAFYTRRFVDQKTAIELSKWCAENEIPNAVPADTFHCSVITAIDAIPDYRPNRVPVLIRPKDLRVNLLNKALVISFDAPTLKKSWDTAVLQGIGMLYPNYVSHVSVSYAVPLDFDLHSVKPPTFSIRLLAEELAPLTPPDWIALGSGFR